MAQNYEVPPIPPPVASTPRQRKRPATRAFKPPRPAATTSQTRAVVSEPPRPSKKKASRGEGSSSQNTANQSLEPKSAPENVAPQSAPENVAPQSVPSTSSAPKVRKRPARKAPPLTRYQPKPQPEEQPSTQQSAPNPVAFGTRGG